MITHPDQARSLLVAHPQLAYALFQALLLNKIVDPAILQVSRSELASLPFLKISGVQRMLAATNTSHPVSAPTPAPPAPAPAAHLPPLPPSVPQFPQPAVHPPYHAAPPPQQIPQSLYSSQVSMHSSPAPPPQQQQQPPMSYYGIPQLQAQQQPPPATPVGAIDGIDPSQKVSSPFSTYRRDVRLTRNAKGDADPSPSFDTRSN